MVHLGVVDQSDAAEPDRRASCCLELTLFGSASGRLGEGGEAIERFLKLGGCGRAGPFVAVLVGQLGPVVGMGSQCARRVERLELPSPQMPGGSCPGSAGFHAMRWPSWNSTTWFSRTLPMVRVMVNTAPMPRMRCPTAAAAKLSLPSQRGCCVGSAMSSKIVSGAAAISRRALHTLVTLPGLSRSHRSTQHDEHTAGQT